MTKTLPRRDFIKVTGGAVAAMALTARAVPSRPLIKKGIMLETLPGKLTVMEKFQLIHQAGFAGVEIPSAMDRKEVLAAQDKTGLTIASVVDSAHWRQTLGDADPAVRAAGQAGLRLALQDAAAYGATSVLLVPAIVNQKISYQQAWDLSRAEIKKAIPLAEQLGVKIAIENVWNYFLLSPLEMQRYVDEFQSPALRSHFDIGNCVNNGWPEQWINILSKRIFKLHLKEYSRKKRDTEGLWKGFQVEYLEGDNNWPAVMQALDETGYEGWGTAEPAYWPPGVDLPTRLGQISRKVDEILAL